MTPVLLWLLLAGPVWGIIGAIAVPRAYRSARLETERARPAGALLGMAAGPLGLGILLRSRPRLRRDHVLLPTALVVAELIALFADAFPASPCGTVVSYVANQLQIGRSVGLVSALMAPGLTLIYSVQRSINSSQGQVVKLGGILAYLLLKQRPVNALLRLPVIGVVAFVA